MTVSATVGQRVTKGDVLAVAELHGGPASAGLRAGDSRLGPGQLATDQGGPDAVTLAQAKNSLSQSYNSYQQAVANRTITNKQNALTLSQAQDAVTSAQNQFDADTAASAPQATLDKDTATLQQAQANVTSTQLKVNQSNQQASQQVTNASLELPGRQALIPVEDRATSSTTIQADQAAVASAEATVDAEQASVTGASITAPADGLIIAVNILPGVNAPSTYAIEESIGPMVATTSFAESDITTLKVGQSATVSVTAPKVSVPGH